MPNVHIHLIKVALTLTLSLTLTLTRTITRTLTRTLALALTLTLTLTLTLALTLAAGARQDGAELRDARDAARQLRHEKPPAQPGWGSV
jgi:hypothetical protein